VKRGDPVQVVVEDTLRDGTFISRLAHGYGTVRVRFPDHERSMRFKLTRICPLTLPPLIKTYEELFPEDQFPN